MQAGSKPILCYVSDGTSAPAGGGEGIGGAPLIERAGRAASAGVDWIQVREVHLETRALFELVRGILTAASASRVIVNDRLDIAITAGAAGVHLGSRGLRVTDVARWRAEGKMPQDFLLGASCHSLHEARAAERDGADYIFFGPVFFTPSKAAYGPPQGMPRLAEVCQSVSLPVLAIGGITVENAGECFRAGAAGVAAIRLFQPAPGSRPEVGEIVARLRAAWREASAG